MVRGCILDAGGKGYAMEKRMFEAASFPHLSRVMAFAYFPIQGCLLEPRWEDYAREAALLRLEAGRIPAGQKLKSRPIYEASEAFEAIARRLQWTPAALHHMKDAA